MIVNDFNFSAGLKEARERGREMVERGLYSRFNLSEKDRVDKAALGCMGEIAFRCLLEKEGVGYEVDNQSFEGRNSDEFDFRVNGKTIDVKVAKLSTTNPPSDRWCFGVPVEQNPRLKDALVIGWVDFRCARVGFYGWMAGERVAAYPVVERNSLTRAPYLTPNHEFRWGDLDKNIRNIWGVEGA